jgi:hypothetical protein
MDSPILATIIGIKRLTRLPRSEGVPGPIVRSYGVPGYDDIFGKEKKEKPAGAKKGAVKKKAAAKKTVAKKAPKAAVKKKPAKKK